MEPNSTPAAPQPQPVAPATSTSADPKTNAILAWLFAPFSSFLFKDDKDAFVHAHARESFYLGIANLAGLVVLGILNVCSSMLLGTLFWSQLGFYTLISCFWGLLWLAWAVFCVVPRIMGIIKANNMQTWEVPYVTKFLSKYIKF